MKQFVSISIAIFYLVVSSGFTLRTHYCMGRVAGIGIGYDAPDHCGRCGMSQHEGLRGGCCKDEHRLIKIDVDQQSTNQDLFSFTQFPSTEQTDFIEPFLPIDFSESIPYPVNHDPPGTNEIAAYLLNCVFLI